MKSTFSLTSLLSSATFVLVFIGSCIGQNSDLSQFNSTKEFTKQIDIAQTMQQDASPLDEEDEDEKTAALDNPKSKLVIASFKKLESLITKKKYKEAAKSMTAKGADSFASTQVLTAIALAKMELPMVLPQLEDVIDELDNLLIKYKLDNLDANLQPMMGAKPKGNDSDQSDADEKDQESKPDDNEKSAKPSPKDARNNIIKAIDKDGNRWQIVDELMQAKEGSPFSVNPMRGEVEAIEFAEDFSYLTVRPKTGAGGAMIQVVTPLTIVRMKKSNDQWKYDGIDKQRSAVELKKFKMNQRNGQAIPSDRLDY